MRVALGWREGGRGLGVWRASRGCGRLSGGASALERGREEKDVQTRARPLPTAPIPP